MFSVGAIRGISVVLATLEAFRLHIAFNRPIETRGPSLILLLSSTPFSSSLFPVTSNSKAPAETQGASGLSRIETLIVDSVIREGSK